MSRSDEENPYRFAYAEDEEPGLVEPDEAWDLGSYVRPAEEPVLSPREVRGLGFDRAELPPTYVVTGLAYAIILGVIATQADSIDWEDQAHLVYFLLAILTVFPAVCLFRSYRAARDLRFGRLASAGLAALTLVPPVNLFVLYRLTRSSTLQLRRHGIGVSFLGPNVAALPEKRRPGVPPRNVAA